MSAHVLARTPDPQGFANEDALTTIGLTRAHIADSIAGTYGLLDRIDAALAADGVDPLCQLVELANLSSMIGNIFGAELAHRSDGTYRRNAPHKYPDLLPARARGAPGGIEIKMALNRNQPKGHLAKEGHYVTCRYVLIDKNGQRIAETADRPHATRAAFWELRTGYLRPIHFNVSNTDGDSGKTAVVNADGMEALKIVYVDLVLFPGSRAGARYTAYRNLLGL